MKIQYLLNISLIAMIIFALGCNPKNSALRIKADQENAKVIIDGEEIGTVPLDVMVSAGKHKIEVHKVIDDENWYYYSEEIIIADNVTQRIDAKLKEQSIKIKSEKQMIVGTWHITNYEDDREMKSDEKRLFKQTIEQLKKRALLTFNSDKTFKREGFNLEIQKGYWKYDSVNNKILLTLKNKTKKEEVNISDLTDNEMRIIVIELVQGKTVTTKITFQKQ